MLMSFILDPNKEILFTMNKNLSTIITKYGNDHTVKNFKGRTPHIEHEMLDTSARNSKDTTPQSNRSKRKGEPGDFSSAMNELSDKKDLKSKVQKRPTQVGILLE